MKANHLSALKTMFAKQCDYRLLASKTLSEKVAGLPRWSLTFLRYVVSNQEINLHELHRSVEVHRLVHIVRRSVVACGDPFLAEFLSIDFRFQCFCDHR